MIVHQRNVECEFTIALDEFACAIQRIDDGTSGTTRPDGGGCVVIAAEPPGANDAEVHAALVPAFLGIKGRNAT